MSKITAQKLKITGIINESEQLRKETLITLSRSGAEADALLSKAGIGIWALEAIGMRKDFKNLLSGDSEMNDRLNSAQRIVTRLL